MTKKNSKKNKTKSTPVKDIKPRIKKSPKKSDTNIKKPSKPKKLNSKERQALILVEMEEKGSWFLKKTELARKYGVSDVQIGQDIKQLLKQMPKEDVNAAKKNIIRIQKAAIKRMELLANEKLFDRKVNVAATKVLIDTCEKYTRTLEDYGDKEKVADKTIICGDLNSSLSKEEKADLLRELKGLNKQ